MGDNDWGNVQVETQLGWKYHGGWLDRPELSNKTLVNDTITPRALP